jgi:hypothetical protein
LDDVFPFKGEHNQDGEQQRDQSDGAYPGDKFLLVPLQATSRKIS